mmetsp:Transcript_5234/g.12610  ORF Transcript_5234/g.12610 Transcript_5234/m.12610 type:complete len:482 (+) Transcript_5234:56-1501(+)
MVSARPYSYSLRHSLAYAMLIGCTTQHCCAKWVSHEEEMNLASDGFRSISLNSHAIGMEHEHSFLQEHAHGRARADASLEAEHRVQGNATSQWTVDEKDEPTIAEILAMLNTDPHDLTYTWFKHEENGAPWYYENIAMVDTNPKVALAKHLIIGHGLGFGVASRSANTENWKAFKASKDEFAEPHPGATENDEIDKNIRARRDYFLQTTLGYADYKGLMAKLSGMSLQSIRHFHEHDHIGPDDKRWKDLPPEVAPPQASFQVATSVSAVTFLLEEMIGSDPSPEHLGHFLDLIGQDYAKFLHYEKERMADALQRKFLEKGPDGQSMIRVWPTVKANWMNPQQVREPYRINLVPRHKQIEGIDVYDIQGKIVYESGWESEFIVPISKENYDDYSSDAKGFETQARMYQRVIDWKNDFLKVYGSYFETRQWEYFGGELFLFLTKVNWEVIAPTTDDTEDKGDDTEDDIAPTSDDTEDKGDQED